MAVRADRLEALSLALRKRARQGEFQATVALESLAGCDGAAFESVARALGYRVGQGEGGTVFRAGGKAAAKKPRKKARRKPRVDADSPFAELRKLVDRRR
jgi:hypothetical protein